jgi:hypothetical protein
MPVTLSPLQRLIIALEEYETVLLSLTVREFDELDALLPDLDLREPLVLKHELQVLR